MSSDAHSISIAEPVAVRSADGIHISYAVRNAGTSSVQLFSKLFDVEPSGYYRLEPSRAYCDLDAPGALVISKALMAVPEGVSVEFPEIPCLEELGPGATSQQRAFVASPVRLRVPYRFAQPGLMDASTFGRVRLCVGFLPRVDGMKLFHGTDTRGLAFVYPEYRAAISQQEIITADLLPIAPGGAPRA